MFIAWMGPSISSRVKALLSIDRPALNDKPFIPSTPKGFTGPRSEIFATIHEGDVLMHQPFESFQPTVDFLRAAADDPDVLAIKMTLYRVGRNSPIVEALLEAIQNGKQVAVLVELKARFDEESNIEWAQKLEREGVHVVYGLPAVKVHCKMAMVVRREGDSIRRYLHLGTGNYNPGTARSYTDLGLFTCNAEIGADVSDLFNYLTGLFGEEIVSQAAGGAARLAQRPRASDSQRNEAARGARRRPPDFQNERA